MPLRLYNTLTKREEDFVPLDPQGKVVSMYTCGPTVYGRPHIGNYASFLMADLLRRWLEVGHGYRVRHVKNITDVGHLLHDADRGDDKIQKEAEREKAGTEGKVGTVGKAGRTGAIAGVVTREDVLAVVERYTQQFMDDERDLRILEPEKRPRASEFIQEQLVLTKILLEKGNAYELPDAIYFSVTSKTPTPYGALSGNTLDQLNAGARVEVHEGKRHPADFALWKKCIGENAKHILRWSYATGAVATSTGDDTTAGFPGWHIECSAMSSSILGRQLDIHTGGEDNIFPHHECEIAQSESALGVKPFVRTWVHRRRIQMGEEKMSKSLGNVFTLPDIVGLGFSPMDLRYYLLSVHYRTNLKFSKKGLEEAKMTRRKISEWVSEVEESKESKTSPSDPAGGRAGTESKEFLAQFKEAMDADLNVSAALAVMFEIMAYSRNKNAFGSCKEFASVLKSTFGCFELERDAIPPEIRKLADERLRARKEKDFTSSDALRTKLLAMGYEVRDVGAEQQLRKL